jgi:signal transduction histidine kinase
MPSLIPSSLVHLVGFLTGAALYAMLLSLAMRARRDSGSDRLPLLTGVLGLVWNVGAIGSWVFRGLDLSLPLHIVTALSYAALGVLPAVVVHSVLRSDGIGVQRRAIRVLLGLAYGLSFVGAALQIRSAFQTEMRSFEVLRMLTFAFIGLMVPLLALTWRQSRGRRSIWVGALAIFAISGIHMSQSHLEDYSWGVELLGHHASVPLAFAILFYDYRFALADTFLKRALALIAIVAVALLAFAGLAIPAMEELGGASSPGALALLVVLSVGIALVYPLLGRMIATFVDRVVLGRSDYAAIRAEIAAIASRLEQPASILDEVCPRIARALSSRDVSWIEVDGDATGSRMGGEDPESILAIGAASELAAKVLIPTTEPPRYSILVGSLTEGRRILSDDKELLTTVALLVARRIDSVRLIQERVAQGAREQELSRLTAEAELRALRAQINPHFLFNTLNTIGYLIRTAPEKATSTLMDLTGLMRSVLASSGTTVTLAEEIRLVEAYLEIEKARFEERLHTSIHVAPELGEIRIPALLLQPLVENAIKHGIAPLRRGGEVVIEAEERNGMVRISVRDSGCGATATEIERNRRGRVGLDNVARRLRATYGDAASLVIESVPGEGTVVTTTLPARHSAAHQLPVLT